MKEHTKFPIDRMTDKVKARSETCHFDKALSQMSRRYIVSPDVVDKMTAKDTMRTILTRQRPLAECGRLMPLQPDAVSISTFEGLP